MATDIELNLSVHSFRYTQLYIDTVAVTATDTDTDWGKVK